MIWMVDNDDTGGLVVVLSVIALLFVIQLIRQRRGSAALDPSPALPDSVPIRQSESAAPEQGRHQLQGDTVVA
ncbi:MAG: hypothetical protein KGK01_06055 [Bradyrhizobium sp.]|uniref:hypothetical protein n=1 Tax=Bradyrhizobium sp. TaxID=376 RepID=UPI00238E8AB8|nr:hypothetical protein [Bradyrhizobium sp.]MDE2066048.1 hypothetical protein [Bradyrhizobium sp.]MDE2242009.1 hypothetical protein [Bradyrhizobium sp.]MDE2470814.1 hypothetical protein [Bradyrhizobium sp.]